jgi:spore germination protein PD
MNMKVVNHALCVGDIRIVGVSSSSVFLIGDTEQIVCSSIFDTPPESVIVGPGAMHLEAEEEEEAEGQGEGGQEGGGINLLEAAGDGA